jgi:hypothetical protein
MRWIKSSYEDKYLIYKEKIFKFFLKIIRKKYFAWKSKQLTFATISFLTKS